MDILTVVLGVLFTAFGIYNLYIKVQKPEVYEATLSAVQKSFGDFGGKVLHYCSRIILPIVVGVLSIILGFMGEGLFS